MGSRWSVLATSLPTALLLAVPGASAQSVRAVSLSLDNDGFRPIPFASGAPTDWYYTHGTRLEVVLDGGRIGGSAMPGPGSFDVARVTVAQEIYTPRDHVSPDPALHDRPYAGWLSMAVSVERDRPWESRSLGVEVGVTGGPSLGREAYRAIHGWLDVIQAQGWDHQIPFRVAWAVTVRGSRAVRPAGASAGWSVEPWGRVRVGSLRTSATTGLRLGVGGGGARPRTWRREPEGGLRLRGWVGVEAEAVARDIFLDGSGAAPRAVRKKLLGRAEARGTAAWGPVAMSLSLTRSTRAFEGQAGGHAFGTLAVTFRR